MKIRRVLPIVLLPFVAQAQTEQEPIELLITGTLKPIAQDSVGTSATVITAEDIEKDGADSVAEILETVPGVSVSRSGGPGALAQISIRGAAANQTLVLIDGVEANNPANGSEFNFANLLTNDVERIEVLRGAQSALWGSDAIGGVINIITKSGRGLEQPKGYGGVEFGTYSTSNVFAGLRGDTGVFDYAFSIQDYSTNGFSSADESTFTYQTATGSSVTVGGNREDDSYDNTTTNLKAGFDINEDARIEGVFRYTDFRNEFDAFTTIPVDSTVARSDGHEAYYSLRGDFAQLDGALNHNVLLYNTDSNTDNFSDFGTNNAKGEKDHYGYQLDYDWGEVNTQGISFGLEWEKDSLDTTFTGDRSITNNGVVGEYRFNGEKFAASANLRYDNNDMFSNKTSWRVALSRDLGQNMRLHTSHGYGVKNPTLTELFGFSADFVGNPNLSPETSHSSDIGIEFTGANYLIDLTYFDLRTDNLITGAGDTAVNISGESKSRGVELFADYEFIEGTSVNFSYTYNDAEDPNGDPLVRRPKNTVTLGVQQSLFDNALDMAANLRYVTDVYDTVFNEDFTTTTAELDDFTVVDLSALYRMRNGISLSARIDNVFDESYEEVLGYGTSGIAYYVGLGYNF